MADKPTIGKIEQLTDKPKQWADTTERIGELTTIHQLVKERDQLEVDLVKLQNTVKWHVKSCEDFEKKVEELEKDGKRLDLIVEHLLIIHPPEPSGDEFDGLWVVCAYELPNKGDCLSAGSDLRRALDEAMVKARG